MKKFFFIVALALVGCGGSSEPTQTSAQPEQPDAAYPSVIECTTSVPTHLLVRSASFTGSLGSMTVKCDSGDLMCGTCYAQDGMITESKQMGGASWTCSAAPNEPSKGEQIDVVVYCSGPQR